MRVITLHDRDEVEALLRRNTYLHLYAIGDLDDFYWEHTTWYGLRRGEPPLLLYAAAAPSVLLALTDETLTLSKELLSAAAPLLPRRMYAHLTEGLGEVLGREYRVIPHGRHYKMGLTKVELLDGVDTSEVVRLAETDARALAALYRESYPGNWFDPHMLATGYYYGVRRGGELVSAAGVHVYSRVYRVAALGNVATRPDCRGQGLAASVSAELCRALLRMVDHVGLNGASEIWIARHVLVNWRA